jgi:hypothetical protein
MRGVPRAKKDRSMLYTLALILLVLWALGFLAFHVGSGLIHLLLVVAVVVVISSSSRVAVPFSLRTLRRPLGLRPIIW